MAFLKLHIFSYEVFITLVLFLLIVYLWFQYKFTYWSRKGVVGPKPIFPFGNIKRVVQRKEQFFEPFCDNYYRYKHLPYVGMYCFNKPVLSINDPDLAKHILIKDFEHFQSHGIFSGGTGDPLAGHLFNLHSQAWKILRLKMSPVFSTSKLKSMYPLVEKIAKEAHDYAAELHMNNKAINFSEFYEKYAMEIVGSVGFGVECNGLKNSRSEFYLRGNEYFNPTSLYWTIVRALAFVMPTFFNKLKLKRINPEIIRFFYNLVKETVDYRYKYCYKRNDFLQALIELKENSEIKNEDISKESVNFTFTFTDIAANTMLYMFAGYETSATTGQFAAYELARNPHIQERAREEINRVLAKYGGECTYEAQNEMVYMNMVLDETMRMHPPMRALFRRCTKDYKLPNSDVVIEEGTQVFVPAHAIQMDPDIFPDPETFDPERFTPERKKTMHPCHWMPFGEGPRKCLGLRQGYIQTKLALVKILQKYEMLLDVRTQVPTQIKASALACAAEGGVWIRLKKLTDCV
ncbi:probable cytochrome P450 6a14 isoform X1 [Maniola hyperantus]|uniref:probable cytochrome P450 6a14 isoform X1 n=1 Tax=Aphantopus hyperantus TaxID=2795564 RepID=UPI00156A249E|nr:probable cytochrome P450 6a14 [Maniola hyperantus]